MEVREQLSNNNTRRRNKKIQTIRRSKNRCKPNLQRKKEGEKMMIVLNNEGKITKIQGSAKAKDIKKYGLIKASQKCLN